MASEEDKKLTEAELELVKDDVASAEASGKPLSATELREKIKEIQKIKEEAAKKEEFEKELRRREDGKAMLEAARKNAELKQKLELEQARKQREADAEYKKRLLEECQRDKEQRRLARNQNAAPTTAPVSAPTPQATVIPTVKSDDCRICFQFPDGKRVNAVFPSSAKFQVVFDHIAENNLFEGKYELHRTYPREAIRDYDKDLIELRLTPASVLAVTKHATTDSVVASNNKDFGSLLFSILYVPFATVIHFFTTLFGFNLNRPEETQDYGNTSDNRRSGPEREIQTERRNRHGHGDDSDDEATWNGNSTQQL
ncbi:hypothetical protein FO519_000758 [Halicephalobus sp. NKZ332]|nr:hypothetical protein FO519_000758 [Halicephalobus sp. NKZ332]